MTYFLLILLAHFISDFSLQNEKLIQERHNPNFKIRLKALLKHVMIHFAVMIGFIVIGFVIKPINLSFLIALFIIITVITITHFFIDWVKFHINNVTAKQKIRALIFIVDQVFHVLIIFICFNILDPLVLNLTFSDRLIAFAILIYVNTIVASHFLSILLEKITPPNTTEHLIEEEIDIKENHKDPTFQKIVTKSKTSYPDHEYQVGRYIGMLERLLIMFFIYSNAVMGVTVILAIKSITRFKQFDDKRFAEYYLIGTLLSITIGFLLGYLARLI